MSSRRCNLFGVVAVLLALMAQLGSNVSVPRIDPVATLAVLCHSGDGTGASTGDSTGGSPANAPSHPADCPVCPLCATLHVQSLALVSAAPPLTPPAVLAIRRSELPPPSTAPPAPPRSPGQPRAPPIFS